MEYHPFIRIWWCHDVVHIIYKTDHLLWPSRRQLTEKWTTLKTLIVGDNSSSGRMAEWKDIINNHLMMGRGWWLMYAANAERRWREEEERRPGVRPPAGRGEGPELPRVAQGERLREENFQRLMIRGRSTPAFMPMPFIQVHHAYIPHYPAARYGQFGYVDPNALVCPRVNNPRPHFPHPQSYDSLPPLPLDLEASTGSSPEESSDSEGGNSMEVNHGSPSAQQ